MMSKKITVTGVILIMLIPSISPAFAQYMGNIGPYGETGANTLEETIKIARDKILSVQQDDAYGSGTPYFAAEGVLGAALLTAGVFGGVSAAFFVRGRKGKYAAPGMG